MRPGPSKLRRWLADRFPVRGGAAGTGGDVRLALAFLVLLVALNLVMSPNRLAPANWGTLLGIAAPLILAAVSVMVPFLAGRGLIDVSVGPLMALINVVIVKLLIVDHGLTSPWIIVPAALLMGMASGALNGFLAAGLRIQPIVATLGTYLIYGGLALAVLPSPAGHVPAWLRSLADEASFLPVAAAAALWLGVKALPYHRQLMATGGDDRAAFSAGIDVTRVRFLAYVLGGLIAGLAALSLTALIASGDPAIGPDYTLIAIAAAALGGVSLAGGIGGFTAAALGGATIFFLQSVLTYVNVSSFVLQLAYGVILVLAVSLNAETVKVRLGLGSLR